MDIKGIIYQSASGHTERYAELMSKQLGIPAYDLFEALRGLNKNDEVIFMGWVRNRDFMGYGFMLRRYSVKAVCAVGAVAPEYGQYVLERIDRRYHISDTHPIFYLQGGFNSQTSKGSDRRIVNALKDDLAKKIMRCQQRNKPVKPYDQALLRALTGGGDYVCKENLAEVMEWYGMAVSEN